MVFTHRRTHQHVPVLLEPGSLAVMPGEARHVWTHGIPPRKTDVFDRVSHKHPPPAQCLMDEYLSQADGIDWRSKLRICLRWLRE